MKKHDENRDVQILSRKINVNPFQKVINVNHQMIIGNKSWGRIDFLVNYCGYTLVWNNISVEKADYNEKKKEMNTHKKDKEHQLTNKNRRKSSKVSKSE